MIPDGTFFLPGPTEVHPEVLAAMARPIIAHRGREFEALFARVQVGLRAVFRTPRTVLIASASATGMMEAGVRAAPAGMLLSLCNGAFADRFATVARECGREVDVLEIPWGGIATPDVVRDRLRAGHYAAVLVTHSETSTGALTDVRAIAAVAREAGVMSMVDAVSSAGATPIQPSDWDIDFVFTGSQKGFALPPGLSFAIASDAFLESAARQPARGRYLDLVQMHTFANQRQTPQTPAVPLFFALDAQLERIIAEGVEQRWHRHAAMAECARSWLEHQRGDGFELHFLPEIAHRSPALSVITLPDDLSGESLVGAVADKGFTIGTGYGKMRSSTVRIGHLGDHTVEGLERCLDVCAEALRTLRSRGS